MDDAMRLISLRVQNFKSLEDVTFTPGNLAALIGPNNAGKSNFARAMQFLSDVYRHGLENAVMRHGGMENVIRQDKNTANDSLSFEIALSFRLNEMHEYLGHSPKQSNVELTCRHHFSLNMEDEGFIVEAESFYLEGNYDHNSHFKRTKHKIVEETFSESPTSNTFVFDGDEPKRRSDSERKPVPGQELVFNLLRLPPTKFCRHALKHWAIYQFNPFTARSESVPTPNAELDLYGRNLPAVVRWLQKHAPGQWALVEETMAEVVPELTQIETQMLHTKTLGLFFWEEGFDRPWRADEVSDGTVLMLSMCCAIADPRKTLVLLEEPENSLHPWILRALIDFIKQVAHQKTVILTTHSPVLIDMLHPTQVWALYREQGASHLAQLTRLDAELLDGWERGVYNLSDYLDSGLILKVIP